MSKFNSKSSSLDLSSVKSDSKSSSALLLPIKSVAACCSGGLGLLLGLGGVREVREVREGLKSLQEKLLGEAMSLR